MLEKIDFVGGPLGYWAFFLALMGGAIGLPIPEEIPLIFAGVAVAQNGDVDYNSLFLVCYFGIVLGDVLIFLIGRRYGSKIFKMKWLRRRLAPGRVRKVKEGLEKRSLVTIFVARHLFYLRTGTFLVCGAVKMSFLKFFVADAVAALISATAMIGLGYLFSEHISSLLLGVAKIRELVIALGVIVVIAVVFYFKRRKDQPILEELG